MTTTVAKKAKASATKDFFVRMLTRDISLEDCILDLVDNSVDQAWRSSGVVPGELRQDKALGSYEIHIEFSEAEFSIVDNCGGMSLDEAAEYAFNFGRDPRREADGYTVGVYGTGLKRAVFKLGNTIVVRSTPSGEQPFRVPINVPAWLRDLDDWDFNIEEDSRLSAPGVAVEIRDLLPEVSVRFATPEFEKGLRRTIERAHLIPLMRGMQIFLNGEPVGVWDIELVTGEEIQPMRVSMAEGSVDIEVIVGVIKDQADDDDQTEDSYRSPAAISGWYVACNGRIITAGDTSRVTGWGDALPRWHSQYNGFIGFIFFNSDNPTLLPMTTTKRDVDVSSELYRRALANFMVPPTKTWIQYTNQVKSESQNRIPSSATSVDFATVPPKAQISLPLVKRTREKVANVNYAVPLNEMRRLADAMDGAKMTFRDVGLRSFQYAYDELVSED